MSNMTLILDLCSKSPLKVVKTKCGADERLLDMSSVLCCHMDHSSISRRRNLLEGFRDVP
jgi:hypothetical protein